MKEKKLMRDIFIEAVWKQMQKDRMIFFLCGDFGAVSLDNIRRDFCDRFINTGIAEQNLINVAVGLALEKYTVYAYGIAPFLTMRPYEQIRNLSIIAQVKELNVNLIGVGAGLSYDLSGPSHHCYEDISIMRLLPNIEVFSPSDLVLTEKFADIAVACKYPKYIRLDGKPVSRVYPENISIKKGFCELKTGSDICLVSTGYMTGVSLEVSEELSCAGVDIGLVDIFTMKRLNKNNLFSVLKNYRWIITLEEGFIGSGGLDGLIADLLSEKDSLIRLKKLGFKKGYVFENGDRLQLHRMNKIDGKSIKKIVEKLWKGKKY